MTDPDDHETDRAESDGGCRRRTEHRPRPGQLALGSVALTLALIGGACGSGDEDSGNSPTVDDDTGSPTPGGSLTYGLEGETGGGWCPSTAQFAVSGVLVANAIFDRLMLLDENREPQPYLAETYTASDDFTTHTFVLREGITFHDGSPLDADVVALNFNAGRGEPEALERTGLQPLIFPILFRDVDSVVATDERTVVVTTSQPWPALPSYVANGRFVIAAEAQLMAGPDGCANSPIGTGPFRMVEWTRNEQMVLEKNQDYWRTDEDGTPLPYLDEIIFKPVIGNANRFDALDGGSLDAGHWNNQFVFEDIEAEPDRFSLVEEPDGYREVAYGMLNHDREPLSDQETRIAIRQAIDPDALRQIANGGKWDLANGPFDEKVMGYVEDTGMAGYDPEAAADFLGGKNLTLVVGYTEDPLNEEMARDIKSQLAAVGVETEIRAYDQSSLINQALGGDWDILLWRNHAGDDPDLSYAWWHSTSPSNFGKINDPEVDRLLEEGRRSSDPDTRRQIYEDLNRRFAETGANLWNWHSEWGVGTAADVHGIDTTTTPDGGGTGVFDGWHFMTEVWREQ